MSRTVKLLLLYLFTGLLGVALSVTTTGLNLEEDFGLGVLFKLRGERAVPPDVVVVAVDRESSDTLDLSRDLKEWPRSTHARLVKELKRQGAAAIIFDIHFKNATTDDDELAKEIKNAGNVVLIEYFSKDIITGGGVGTPVSVERAIPPTEKLATSATATATFPLPTVPIRVSQAWTFRGDFGDSPTMPAVAMQIFAGAYFKEFSTLLRASLLKQDLGNTNELFTGLEGKGLKKRIRSLKKIFEQNPGLSRAMTAELDRQNTVATDNVKYSRLINLINMYSGGDSIYLNFYGPPRTIPTVPYHVALQSGNKQDFKDKIVFVGTSRIEAYDQKDTFYTVFSQANGLSISGVEICATTFANLLENLPVIPLGMSTQLIGVFIWGLIIVFVWIRFTPVKAMAFTVFFIVAYMVTAYLQFSRTALWLPVVTPVFVQAPIGSFMALLLNYFETRRERNLTKEALGYYLPNEKVDELSQGLENIKAGELVTGTCLFSDVKGYTTLSESMDPEELRVLMNEYYEAIFEPVKRYGGIVLGVQGDSMLAVWTSKEPDPELRGKACSAALEVAQAVTEFNKKPGRAELQTRIGLHTGEMSLGSVGGGSRLEYTVMGDIVNTSARLEGMNKYMGTGILASGDVLGGLTEFYCRQVGDFALTGKQKSIMVYELISLKGEETKKNRELTAMFTTGLGLCKRQKWTEATELFSTILQNYPLDGPTKFYQNFCKKFVNTPGEKWNGVIRLKNK